MADDFSIHNPLPPPPATGKIGDHKEGREGQERRKPKKGTPATVDPPENVTEGDPGGRPGASSTGKVLDITI
jgi:hypothetical protein